MTTTSYPAPDPPLVRTVGIWKRHPRGNFKPAQGARGQNAALPDLPEPCNEASGRHVPTGKEDLRRTGSPDCGLHGQARYADPRGPCNGQNLTRGQPTEEHVIQPAQASGMGYPLG